MVKPEYELMSRLRTVPTAPVNPDERAQIIAALWAWIKQRPGLEYGNYGDPKAYRAELRSITKDLHQARALLRFVELRGSITADMLKRAMQRSFSGRLSWVNTKPCAAGPAVQRLEYCTGQYWPTEYRRAVCAVLAGAIWYWWRDHCMPKPKGEPGDLRYEGLTAGAYLRRNALREFGRGLASRWFT